MDPSKQTEDEQYVLAGEAVVAPNGGMKRGHKCTFKILIWWF